jgi:hypothetical protein
MVLEGMFKKFNKLTEPSKEAVRAASAEMDAFLKRDFEALPPAEQKEMLETEATQLRNEVEMAKTGDNKSYANELESKFDDLVRQRAELALNERLRGIK